MQVMGSIVLNTSVNTPTVSNSGLQAYPNPTKDRLYLFNTENIKQIGIYDLQGRLIHQTPVQNILDVSFLNRGVYLLKADNRQVIKVIKE